MDFIISLRSKRCFSRAMDLICGANIDILFFPTTIIISPNTSVIHAFKRQPEYKNSLHEPKVSHFSILPPVLVQKSPK